MLRKVWGVFCLACLLLAGLAQADERILSYHSDIQINADRSMIVTETIRVRAEGKKIRHGIYRDFPTRYSDRHGNDYHVGFRVLSVQRDGRPESYHQKDLANGVRTYLGKSNYSLPQGEYTYIISYRTTHQLGFFSDFDELYWNVTGNGWDFAIDNASALVRLETESSLRRALERDQFELWYQPQYDMGSEALVGFEALLRWNHPERGVLLPEQFLVLLEETSCRIARFSHNLACLGHQRLTQKQFRF